MPGSATSAARNSNWLAPVATIILASPRDDYPRLAAGGYRLANLPCGGIRRTAGHVKLVFSNHYFHFILL